MGTLPASLWTLTVSMGPMTISVETVSLDGNRDSLSGFSIHLYAETDCLYVNHGSLYGTLKISMLVCIRALLVSFPYKMLWKPVLLGSWGSVLACQSREYWAQTCSRKS
jgi:hypothetical protein